MHLLLTLVGPEHEVHPMYVCVCHALTDADIRSAKARGVASDSEFFRQFGVEPQCGYCVVTIRHAGLSPTDERGVGPPATLGARPVT